SLPIVAMTLLAVFIAINKLHDRPLAENVVLVVNFALLSSAFAVFLLAVVLTDQASAWLQRILRFRVVTQFGKYAYGLYVYHVPFMYLLTRLDERVVPAASLSAPWFVDVRIVVGFALTYGVASASYNHFEKRLLALKERFRPEFGVTKPQRLIASLSLESGS